MAIDKTVDSLDERPAEDSVDGDVVTESNAHVDGAAIGAPVRKNVGDYCTELAAEGIGGSFVGIGNSTCEANRFEWLSSVVGFDEGDDAGRVGCGESAVESVGTTVEAGASVEECD